MNTNKKTYYQLILDKSGSMWDCQKTAVFAFNKQMSMIKELKKRHPEQEFSVSLTTFNHKVFFDIDRKNPDSIKRLRSGHNTEWTKNEQEIIYEPNGTTALYDAIGMSVANLQANVGREISDDYASVVCVIITDGYENASVFYSLNQIQSIIKELEASKNWIFTYISETQDAVEYAMKMNIKEQNAAKLNKSNLYSDFEDLNDSLNRYAINKTKNIKDQYFLKSRRKK